MTLFFVEFVGLLNYIICVSKYIILKIIYTFVTMLIYFL